jgi:S-adenosylmethionine-diacylglycerol 3-amino-3-carboxypropyl transferase
MIEERASFDLIRYASVWEDAAVLCEALAPVAAGARLLSIASAGDNVLTLLTLDPSEIVAVDLSAAQLACLELRMAAFRALGHDELLAFLGILPATDRAPTYAVLRSCLPDAARAFWDGHPEEIGRGVVHAGKFERYFHLFRRCVLPLVHSRRTVEELGRQSDVAAQRAFYRTRWDGARWRLLFRVFFSRAVMGRWGRDPAFFAQVQGAVGERILERTKHALTEVPASSNPFLQYILSGEFPVMALPDYLKPEHHETIRARLDRVRVVRGAAEKAGPGGFHGFNLSDIFEYMTDAEFERSYGALLDQARSGARLVYWNMLVPRSGAARFPRRARRLDALSDGLHAGDRAWFYTGFHVDEALQQGAHA